MAGRKQHREKTAPALSKSQKRNIYNIVGTSVVVILGALVLWSAVVDGARPPRRTSRQSAQQAADAGRNRSECPTRAGQDWEYDEPTRCYFDPSPGHGHWHVGQPPAPAERARLMSTQPAPPVTVTPTPPTPPGEEE